MTAGRRLGVVIHHTARRLGILPPLQRLADRILDRLTR